MLRRAVDIVASAAGLLVAAPVLGAAMLAIRLETPGHPIYRQRRAGLRGAEFDVYKLRTMVDGAEHIGAGLAIDSDDARITRVGRLLRRLSLDELPQLLNVLRGEMSLIGPRPTLPVQVRQYDERQRGRLAVKPGLTGWAQVNGRAALPWSERIELDLFYIEHRSLALDARILWRTIAIVLGGEGMYKGAHGGWHGAPLNAGAAGGGGRVRGGTAGSHESVEGDAAAADDHGARPGAAGADSATRLPTRHGGP